MPPYALVQRHPWVANCALIAGLAFLDAKGLASVFMSVRVTQLDADCGRVDVLRFCQPQATG